jgi:cytochrome c2
VAGNITRVVNILGLVLVAVVLAGIIAGVGWVEYRDRSENIRLASSLTGGRPDVGRQRIEYFGCGSCHTIPGVRRATATVGPPLEKLARRSYIAGVMDNTPENLIRWIQDPPGVDAKTAMPRLGVSGQDARDIAAYLYTLR